jgi:hypothetical protein
MTNWWKPRPGETLYGLLPVIYWPRYLKLPPMMYPANDTRVWRRVGRK